MSIEKPTKPFSNYSQEYLSNDDRASERPKPETDQGSNVENYPGASEEGQKEKEVSLRDARQEVENAFSNPELAAQKEALRAACGILMKIPPDMRSSVLRSAGALDIDPSNTDLFDPTKINNALISNAHQNLISLGALDSGEVFWRQWQGGGEIAERSRQAMSIATDIARQLKHAKTS